MTSNIDAGNVHEQPSGDAEPNPSTAAFDLASLRLSQDYTSSSGVKKIIQTVPVRKPSRQAFIRVHPAPGYRLTTATLVLKEERNETYLVDRPLWDGLGPELVPTELLTAIDRQGVLFIWPIRMPSADGRLDSWSQSSHDAAELATRSWVSVRANMGLGAYEPFVAEGNLPEPDWPDLTFQQILEIAFKDRFIRAVDHPVLRRLRGEV